VGDSCYCVSRFACFWVVLPAGIASSTLFAQEQQAAPGENVLPDVSRDSSLRVVLSGGYAALYV